jgi:hypothetical protein
MRFTYLNTERFHTLSVIKVEQSWSCHTIPNKGARNVSPCLISVTCNHAHAQSQESERLDDRGMIVTPLIKVNLVPFVRLISCFASFVVLARDRPTSLKFPLGKFPRVLNSESKRAIIEVLMLYVVHET